MGTSIKQNEYIISRYTNLYVYTNSIHNNNCKFDKHSLFRLSYSHYVKYRNENWTPHTYFIFDNMNYPTQQSIESWIRTNADGFLPSNREYICIPIKKNNDIYLYMWKKRI